MTVIPPPPPSRLGHGAHVSESAQEALGRRSRRCDHLVPSARVAARHKALYEGCRYVVHSNCQNFSLFGFRVLDLSVKKIWPTVIGCSGKVQSPAFKSLDILGYQALHESRLLSTLYWFS